MPSRWRAITGDAVERALALKKTGNELLRLLGGREIHPINARVGGFYRVPSRAELAPLAEALKLARDQAVETLRWTADFPFPEFSRDYEFVALRHPDEYPMNAGQDRLFWRVSTSAAADYESEFIERQVPHSTALHSRLKERGAYFVGAMARYALNRDRLPADIRTLADEIGLEPVCRNPFRSILVRGVEVIYACDEALRLIAATNRRQALRPSRAVGCYWLCLHRGAPRHPLSPLPSRCRRTVLDAPSFHRPHKIRMSSKKICERSQPPASISTRRC